jgi:hypothetical protein
MITLTNPGLPACFLRKEEALPSTKPLIKHTLTCLDYCCLPAVLASLAYLFDFVSKPKTRFSGKHSRGLKESTSKAFLHSDDVLIHISYIICSCF